MKSFIKVLFILYLVFLTQNCFATGLFQPKKSDSNIKPLIFPLSMVVIENRPSERAYFPIDRTAPPVATNQGLDLSDKNSLKKTLGATDPAKITPARIGEPYFGFLNKKELGKLAKENFERILFIFRREIGLSGNQDSMISNSSPFHLKVKTEGILYLTKQRKILVLRPNEKESDFSGNDIGKQLVKFNRAGLKDLAIEAKKILDKNKYEKRRSNY